jgi:hypothetical protein
MKSQVTKAQSVVAEPQLILPIRPQRNPCMVASDCVLPEVLKLPRGLRELAT